ncbi:MAG: zinc-ribbon domain-containing protein [Oscillospiraceae bacterium]|nr:zinc-ribbon domain-containing protein [Oscillospiraceae bacterium]
MFCRNCGQQINEGASFCSNCGEKIATPAGQAKPPVTPASQRTITPPP